MAMYILRKIDDALWKRFQDRAKAENFTMRNLMLALVSGYADGRIKVTTEARTDNRSPIPAEGKKRPPPAVEG